MKNKLAQLKQTWTYKNKMLILSLSLALVCLIQSGKLDRFIPTLPTYAATVEYSNPPQLDTIDLLEAKIKALTVEIYNDLEPVNMERARQEAIQRIGRELIQSSLNSPYIDYDNLTTKQ